MSPLQKSPRGLLELFNLKTLGRAPRLFSDSVQAVADVRDFYGTDRLATAYAASAAGLAPRVVDLAVTGTWRIHAVSASCILGGVIAGSFYQIRVDANVPNDLANELTLYGETIVDATAAWRPADELRVGSRIHPLVLPPGSMLHGTVLSNSNQNVTATVQIVYEDLTL